jgi:tetratricopeptide (TPR) repeat protein
MQKEFCLAISACSLFVVSSLLPSTAQDPAIAKPQTSPATQDRPLSAGPSQSIATPNTNRAPANPFAEAMDSYHKENYGHASEQFTQVGDSGATNAAAAYAWAARAALHLKRLQDAEADVDKATRISNNLFTVQSATGELYFRRGKFHEAEEIYRKIIMSKTRDPRSYLGLERIYRATANYKSAKAMIDVARALDDEDPDIFWEWFRTLNRKERMEALKTRLAMGGGDDADKQQGMLAMFTVLQDRERKPERACRPVNKLESTETNLEPLMIDAQRLRGFGLAVKVNEKSAKLLIDTGASGILISSKVAEKAGVERIVDQDVRGIGDKGASHGYIAYAAKLQIGDLQFENCYVDVVDRKTSLDEEGLIGPDVFEDYIVDLDFPNRKFRLSPLPPFPDQPDQSAELRSGETTGPHLHDRYIAPEYAKFDKIYRIGHFLLVPTRLNSLPPVLFILDTGAWDNTVTPSAAREASKVYADADMKVRGLSGEVNKVYTTGDITLTFGSFQQKRRDLVAFDMTNMSDHAGTEISGTLGFAMLWLLQIKIDYRDNLVNFTYDPNRLH